jgi:hypothetical protein
LLSEYLTGGRNHQIRRHAPPGTQILPDDTVIFVFGKPYFGHDASAIIDAIFLLPFGGDPGSDSYQDAIPDLPYPIIISTGTVLSTADSPLPPHSVMSTSEFVDGGIKTFTLMSVFSQCNVLA